MSSDADAVKKPWWYQALLAISMIVGAAIVWGLSFLLFSSYNPTPAIFGALAGALVIEAILGFRPGRYRYLGEDEVFTLWKPIPTVFRALLGAGAPVVVGVGLLVAWHDASEEAAKAKPAQATSAPAKASAKGKR